MHALAKQRSTKTLGLLFKLYSIVNHIVKLKVVSQLPWPDNSGAKMFIVCPHGQKYVFFNNTTAL